MILQKLIILAGLLGAFNAQAALSNLDKSLVTRDNNMLTNPGFESGKAGWENFGAAGTYTTTSTAANVYQGGAAGSWDSNGSAQTFRSSLISAAGRAGGNGVASCVFKAASGTATHTLNVQDNLGATLATASINATSSAYTRVSVNFPFGSITSARVTIASVAANEPELFVDSCFLGSAQDFNLSQVSQASLYGTLTYPTTASCTWSTTSSSFADFSADSDCTASPTVSGGMSAPATKIPAARALNLPSGTYMVVANGEIGSTGGASDYRGLRIYDGTTVGAHVTANTSGSAGSFLSSIVAMFTYTSVQSSVTFSVQGVSSSGSTVRVQNDGTPLTFTVYRFPSSSELAYRPDLAVQWGGISVATSASDTPGGTGAWEAPSNASWATKTLLGSATAGTTANELSFRMPYLAAGSYEVITNYQIRAANSSNCHMSVFDGTTRFGVATASNGVANGEDNVNLGAGIITYSSAQTNKEFTIQFNGDSTSNCTLYGGLLSGSGPRQFFIKPVGVSVPAPLLVGSVTSNSSGLERVERATILNNGSVASISSQSGSWLSSVTRTGTGVVGHTIAAGIFSAAPTCVCSNYDTGGEAALYCGVNNGLSATNVAINTRDAAGNKTDSQHMIVCMGPR